MNWNGLERNKLDFILTDLLPVELSELFSFRPFYDFLLKKENQSILAEMSEAMKKAKAEGNKALFKSGWATKPMKYNILKGTNFTREMSLIQPLSALNILLFMECYQKDVLNFFERKRCYSIRYHKKNTSLYYKAKTKKGTAYFQRQSKRAGAGAIQQTGSYFSISPFESINSFADSRIWRIANFQYRYFAKMDYKSCFDSIYTHSYKWIIERNVIDSKGAENSNLFIAIDRVLQNINGLSSNGLIVGPEFSRMIAEVLLQQIDSEILLALSTENILKDRDYLAFRYVDDVFLFANSPDVLDKIIAKFNHHGEKYLLRLNEMKLTRGETPLVPKNWLEKSRELSDKIEGFFHNIKKTEYDELSENERHLVKSEFIKEDRLKDEITVAMKEYSDDRRTIVSFLLSTLLNNIGKKRFGFTLFEKNKTGKAMLLIDFALFVYSFCPSFDQTRKIISIIVYIENEVNFKNSIEEKRKLKNIIDRYYFAFQRGNIFDLCDWFPFMREYCISFDVATENELIKKADVAVNPIVWANMLIYSSYNNSFFNDVKKKVDNIIETQLSQIINGDVMLHEAFWFVLVFHNCPHISPNLKVEISNLIGAVYNRIIVKTTHYPSDNATKLICEFLQCKNSSGVKPEDSFFNWGNTTGISAMITYRTFQRTIFKRYQRGKYSLYVSLD